MALVEFTLDPLESIEPWGSPPDRMLHWFGLTWGCYHLDLGLVRLLEYTPAAGPPHCVDYQVARIHEDLVSMLPSVLEPIPPAVMLRLRDGSFERTYRHLRKHWTSQQDPDPSVDAVLYALGERSLDTAYLNPGAGIWMWSYGTKIIIEWDNRGRLFDGKPAWTAVCGRHEIDRDQFLNEMYAFDRRLMSEMDGRIHTIQADWCRPDVRIDVARLVENHNERCRRLEVVLRRQHRPTDWLAVQKGLELIGSSA